MSGLTIGLTLGFAAAGGALGFSFALMDAIGRMWSGGRSASPLGSTIIGAFAGAALGAGSGWVFSGGPSEMIEQRREQSAISACVKDMGNGRKVTLERTSDGKIICAPAP